MNLFCSRKNCGLLHITALLAVTNASSAATLTIDFEELPLDAADFYNGADLAGGFVSYGMEFNNMYTNITNSCCWNGWAYSQTTDTATPGAVNQYSAFTGSGATGSARYGVAFSGLDAGGGIIPEIDLPAGSNPTSVKVTNTTYAALSMVLGDGFAKRFGGPSGDDPDWFLLTVQGFNSADTVVGDVSLYLADYRFSNPAEDYVLDQWTNLELTSLAGLGVRKLSFRLSSSDSGQFGMNTPAYFAIDNLVLDVTATAGDFDLNGSVDQLDLDTWNQHYGVATGASLTQGDSDGDGDVDGLDFLTWQRHVTVTASLVHAIPEPTTLILAGGLIAIAWSTGPFTRQSSLDNSLTS